MGIYTHEHVEALSAALSQQISHADRNNTLCNLHFSLSHSPPETDLVLLLPNDRPFLDASIYICMNRRNTPKPLHLQGHNDDDDDEGLEDKTRLPPPATTTNRYRTFVFVGELNRENPP